MTEVISRIQDKPKKQCYFYVEEKRGCYILKDPVCKGCKFYKTSRQFIEDFERAEKLNGRKESND